MKTQRKVVRKKNAAMVGEQMEVVIDGYHPDSNLLLVARHAGQCPEIDSHIIINDPRKVSGFGQRYQVEIVDFADYDLIATIL